MPPPPCKIGLRRTFSTSVVKIWCHLKFSKKLTGAKLWWQCYLISVFCSFEIEWPIWKYYKKARLNVSWFKKQTFLFQEQIFRFGRDDLCSLYTYKLSETKAIETLKIRCCSFLPSKRFSVNIYSLYSKRLFGGTAIFKTKLVTDFNAL